ncbi:MAG: 4-alpha-glucanotransferase, partial [Actinomycetota bacterium]|nr:4-alpha-glucanotransferase [Actinomycetota bacterium]
DAHEVGQVVPTRTIEALRAAIGQPPADLEEAAPLVLRPGSSLAGLPGVVLPLQVICEDGSERQLDQSVPVDFPLGYHRIRSSGDVRTSEGVRIVEARERMLIVSPGRCWLPDGWRAWGWTVQLYAARSAATWGIGDLGDLRSIREWAQDAGAGFLLVNPLHAVAPTFPQESSPYLPASRRFHNPLYLRVDDVAGAGRVDLDAARAAGLALSDLPLIDRDEAWRVKRAALQQIFQVYDGGDGFAGWRTGQGQPLEEFATWAALADELGPDFHDWPVDLQRPESVAVARFRDEHESEIAFHAWLQWAVEEQVRTSTDGMTVLQDLPIGVDGGGADAWAWQDQLAGEVRIGAPPDLFNSNGQNWGSPPLIPWRLRAAGYEPFIAAIRSTMAATGGLRIDHVMGLFRLWWVPADGSPTDGAYVRYPSADLLNIVALESHRAQAIVVGEDLGTVEPGVREALAEHRILSYKLLVFEDDPPADWPAMSMAAVTTHDLPTVAGLWSGADVAEQLSFGGGPEERLVEGDAELRARLAPGLPGDASPEAAVVAAHERLAQSPATLLSASLEDAVAEQRRPNMPGVPTRPNWSLPMAVRIEDLASHPTAAAIARTLSAAIARPSRPTQGPPATNLASQSSPHATEDEGHER